MFEGLMSKFVKRSAVSVMMQGALEYVLESTAIDAWFETVRDQQYTRKLLFSSVLAIMLEVVCKHRGSISEAFRHQADVGGTLTALYDKISRTETSTARALVQMVAQRTIPVIDAMGGAKAAPLPGYRTRILDGNCLKKSEHRLKVLRTCQAAPLPGKSLVIFDPQYDIACDVIPCEDAYVQERALLDQVIPLVQPNDLWLADRNFCVAHFLADIHQQGAYFVIRHHRQLTYEALGPELPCGTSETGELFEQAVRITDGQSGRTLELRRVVVRLFTPTGQGEAEITLLSNLPPAVTTAKIAELYRARWGIEGAFQRLENHLKSEIDTLAYPKAALFGFCVGLVAFNLLALIMAALRTAHPEADCDNTVSTDYLAREISTIRPGMLLALDDQHWAPFRHAEPSQFAAMFLYLAANVPLATFRKAKRRPKKPPQPRTEFSGRPHVSTARLLA